VTSELDPASEQVKLRAAPEHDPESEHRFSEEIMLQQ
jgi:hypothetical protein